MGDFSANFHRPESGIHTIEGNLAGSRAARLTKKRQSEQATFEKRKQKLKLDSEKASKTIDSKFNSNTQLSTAEQRFRAKTVGLVTAEEFKKATLEAELAKQGKTIDCGNDDGGGGDGNQKEKDLAEQERMRKLKKKQKKKLLKKKKQMMSTLSFADAEDAEGMVETHFTSLEEESPNSNKKVDGSSEATIITNVTEEIKKNPNVDTSFLPDRKREEAALAERERLKQEWYSNQEKIKKEMLEITYSYWDGSGHRRVVRVAKGQTIGEFLELVRKELAKEFREIGNVSSDALLYVKEDLIIPQDITFYDLIATRARGKSGPLFNFDVHDDVRVGAIDRRIEKDESHPGKVVERRWYDRNKHIFPASRWEVFDPAKEYGSYTIHGREVN